MFLIKKKKMLNPTVGFMQIKAPLIAKNAKPGQFIMLRVDDVGERIPLTIFASDDDSVSILYQIVGLTTKKLNLLNQGDYIQDVAGPMGKPTDLEHVKKVIVIGGGVGSAIAYPIAKALANRGVEVTTILGFRSIDLAFLIDEFKALSHDFYLMTDDGSSGNKGFVTDALAPLISNHPFDRVYAIGPLVMMKSVSLMTKEKQIETIVSMNPIMVDGTGMCGGCRVTVGNQTKFACVDGPDFDGHLIDFDEAIKRNAMYQNIEKRKHYHLCKLLGENDEK